MAAIGAPDVTVAVSKITKMGKVKRIQGTMTFGDGSLTYSTAGIPLPAPSVFGFVSFIDNIEITGNNARTTEYLYRYNKAAHKLLCYVSHDTAGATTAPMDEAGGSHAPAARTLDWIAHGW